MSQIPVLQAGPRRPRTGQGLAGRGPLELCPGLSSLFPQGHTLSSRPWGASGDPESRPRSSPNPLCSLLTFNDFNAGAIKNKVLSPPSLPHGARPGPLLTSPPPSQAQSVREVFARQLMQVRGVSGEKAAAIVDQYSTPAR